MKYFKLSSLSFYKNLGINILFIFEILVLLLAVNITIASNNGKIETTRIFEDALTQEGYMVWYYERGGQSGFSAHPDYKVSNENNTTIKNFYNIFKGDITVREFTSAEINFNNVCKFNSNIPESIMDYICISAIVLDDDIFEKLGFSLSSGSYPSAVTSENYVEAIITQNDFGFKTGTTLSASDFYIVNDYIIVENSITYIETPMLCDIKISGVLTKNTYLLSGTSWNYPMNIEQLFDSYSYISNDYTTFMYISKSSAERLFDLSNLSTTPISYIYYNSEPTAEEKEYNDRLIKFMRECGADIITLDEFAENSQSYFNDISKKITPIIIIVIIIILIGLISSTAINTNLQLRNYSVYFLCGANWKSCINIVISNLIKISGIALIFSIIILQLAEILFNINGLLGLSYGLNNVLITFGVIAFVIVLSCLIPYFIIRNSSPIQIFRKNKV